MNLFNPRFFDEQQALEAVATVLEESWRCKLAEADLRLAQAAAEGGNESFYDGRQDDPLRKTARIDSAIYHAFGQNYGYEAWDDPGVMRDYLKRHPAGRIRARNARLQVGWTRGLEHGCVRFRKRYPAPEQ